MSYTFVMTLLAMGVMLITEILRSVIHKRRELKFGIGGTQDIAMYGTFTALFLMIAGVAIDLVRWFT